MENKLTNNKNSVIAYVEKYSPYILFFILIFVLHILIQAFIGIGHDDLHYQQFLTKYSLSEFIITRYNTWSYRVIIDVIVSLLSRQNMILWSLLDTTFYTAGAYYIIKIINRNSDKQIAFIGILLFLSFPFLDVGQTGWIATTANYLWTFALGVVSFIPLINKSYNENTSPAGYLIAIVALIFATNQEQCCLLILGFHILYLIHCYINKVKIHKYSIFAIIISIIALLLFIKCPGTSSRFTAELARYPNFVNFGILQKIYLGTIPTINILLENKIVITIFYTLLSLGTLLKSKNKYIKYISVFNIGFILSLTIFKPLLLGVFPEMSNIFNVFALKAIPSNMMLNRPVLIAILITIYLLVSCCLMLYKTFDKNIFPTLIFIAGFASRLMMGFSPTIFASSTRTTTYFYMLMIMLTLMLIKRLYDEHWFNENEKVILTGFILLLAVLNYLNIFIQLHV